MALLKYYFTVNPGKILPLHYLSAYDDFLEYGFRRKAVLGMKGALTAIRMALTALCLIRKLPGWVL